MNFAYVRSLIALILAALSPALIVPEPAGATAPPGARVTIALLPRGTSLEAVASVPGMALGLLSAGIGDVPAAQTYLDMSQGNRVADSLYDGELPRLDSQPGGVPRESWARVLARAQGVPADLRPGLLAETIRAGGLSALAAAEAGSGRLIAAGENGRVDGLPMIDCFGSRCFGLRVVAANAGGLAELAASLERRDMVIAVERPPPSAVALTLGIAGEGFRGGALTSESTRTTGLVSATDLAPTVLERLGLPVPGEMNGEPVRAAGEGGLTRVVDLRDRLEETVVRRGPVVGGTLAIWAAVAMVAIAIGRARAARVAIPIGGLAVAYLPAVLLVAPAIEPSLAVERLVAGLVPVALAAASWRWWRGWRALGVACLVSVAAYAVDVLAGSALIPLSVAGSNPASGSRFYGIGNEIEATLGVLVPVGAGALLASIPATRDGGRTAAALLLGAGLLAGAVFSLGRFGADVGAAIVLPAGGAVAAAIAMRSRRGLMLAAAVPVAAVAALMGADVLTGGGAHLTRSVLEAGGLDGAAQVLERRLELAGQSFTRLENLPFLAATVLTILAAAWKRRTIVDWFGEGAALAGFAGALAATALGAVSNDSGATVAIVGSALCLGVAGFAWGVPRAPSLP